MEKTRCAMLATTLIPALSPDLTQTPLRRIFLLEAIVLPAHPHPGRWIFWASFEVVSLVSCLLSTAFTSVTPFSSTQFHSLGLYLLIVSVDFTPSSKPVIM